MSFECLALPSPFIPYTQASWDMAYHLIQSYSGNVISSALSSSVTASGSAAASSTVAAASGTTAATSSLVAPAVSSITGASSAANAAAAAASSGSLSSLAAFSAVALPIAVSVMAVLAAGMVIDIARMQRELRRRHTLSIETVFTRRDQLIEALFSQCGEDECHIYEEDNGDLIVRYQLQDYFFRMDESCGFFKLEIENAQHPQDELTKINQIQSCYLEAVRRHSYEGLMEAVRQNGWTVERDETGADGSQYISIII